jgi:hypothetical protein
MEFKKPDLNNSGTGKPADAKNADAKAVDAKGKAKTEKKPKKEKPVFLDHRDMNFYERYEVVVEGKQVNVDPLKLFKPAIIVLLIVLVIVLIMKIISFGVTLRCKSLNNYINDSANKSAYNTAVTIQKQTASINKKETDLKACVAAIKTYPSVNSQFFATIQAAAANAGASITNVTYDNTTGLISLSCTATTVAGPAAFVNALNDSGLFSVTDYTGYSGTQAGGYTFTVAAYCNGN